MAFGINTVSISGNLTRDPDVHSGGSGDDAWTIVNLRIAWNQRVRNRDTHDWDDVPNYFDVKFTGGTGKWLGENLVKGDRVVVSGQLRWREWQDKEGNKRQQVYVDARDVVTSGSGGGSSNGESRGSSSGSRGSSSGSSEAPVDGPPPRAEGPVPVDDDIPFHHDEFDSYEDRREHSSRW